MIQGPLNGLNALALVLRRGSQRAHGYTRPVITAIELEELQVAHEDGQG